MSSPFVPDSSCDYALPPASLHFLRELITTRRIKRVFEFGSGKSTEVFLAAGCATTSLEDSAAWLEETAKRLPENVRSRWRPICQPLESMFLQGAPLKGWRLGEVAAQDLRAADLVLIDSPAFPPFREQALVEALRRVENGLIVVDDANIPTVSRFCQRLARANERPSELWASDHGLAIITVQSRNAESAAPTCSPEQTRGVRVARGWWETIKAWRRYALA